MITTAHKVSCFHCGEVCPEQQIEEDGKSFCCAGCKSVHDILVGSNLGQYYDLEVAPGRPQATPRSADQFAILDDDATVRSLLDFWEGDLAKITLYIPVIHCSSCIWLLEHLPQLHPGIRQSRVNFLRKTVNITFRTDQISLRKVAEMLSDLGYVPEVSLASVQAGRKDQRSNSSSLAIKIGVAGFCFGNAMLLSLPEYLDVRFGLEADYREFFGYLNLLLALPVVCYPAAGYFTSAVKGLRHRHINLDVPIALGILALFARSVYEVLSQTGPGYVDSLNGLVFFLLIGQWYQSRTYQALSYERDYASYFPIAVIKLLGQQEIPTRLPDLNVGDRVLIRHQELIPADAVLLRGRANIDYSFVTGEAMPVTKQHGDLLYAGGRQNGSSLTIEIRRPVANSYLTQLWNQDVFQKPPNSSLTTLAQRVGQYFTLSVLLISLGTAVYWLLHDRSMLLNTVTSVLIVACPCALALSIPFAYGHTLRWLGRQGMYLKSTEVVEKLASIDHIVFDKTGTITNARSQPVAGQDISLTAEEQTLLRSIVRHSTHPLSTTLYQSLPASSPLEPVDNFRELPGLGLEALIKGQRWRVGSAAWVDESSTSSPSATRVYVKVDDHIKGYYEFVSEYRVGFGQLMQRLNTRFCTHLLSGDQDRERKRLSKFFRHLHFRQSPTDKLNYVKQLVQQKRLPLMVGDGLNDAGALKQSYVGIAVADNVYQFSPACDAILSASRMRYLDSYLQFVRSGRRIVKTAFLLSFVYNAIGLSFAVSGMLTPLIAAILMPLSSVSVVGFITLAVYLRARQLPATEGNASNGTYQI